MYSQHAWIVLVSENASLTNAIHRAACCRGGSMTQKDILIQLGGVRATVSGDWMDS